MIPLLTKPLNGRELLRLQSTISSNAFYYIVIHNLLTKGPLSIVRMADGELSFMKQCLEGNQDDLVENISEENPNWLKDFGCQGITKGELRRRLDYAAIHCSFFGPSLSGYVLSSYDVTKEFIPSSYNRIVDNFFPNMWDEQMKMHLYRTAKHVIMIHKNRAMADALQIRCRFALGVKLTYIELSNWDQSEKVIEQARQIEDAPLVIFSGGPASKYIAPRIATMETNKVVLDIGQAMERWLLPSLKDLPQVIGRYDNPIPPLV